MFLDRTKHHNQIDYIMVQRRFQSSVYITKTRRFPGAGISSYHNLVMMTFCLWLKKMHKQGPIRIKFDLEELKDPDIAQSFQATKGGKFAPLILRDTEDSDTLIYRFNTTTEAATKILGKHQKAKTSLICVTSTGS